MRSKRKHCHVERNRHCTVKQRMRLGHSIKIMLETAEYDVSTD